MKNTCNYFKYVVISTQSRVERRVTTKYDNLINLSKFQEVLKIFEKNLKNFKKTVDKRK